MTREEHLLLILAEEAVEVAHRTAKILRFGIYDIEPGKVEDNAEELMKEVDDLLGTLSMIAKLRRPNEVAQAVKRDKIENFLQYSERKGTLT